MRKLPSLHCVQQRTRLSPNYTFVLHHDQKQCTIYPACCHDTKADVSSSEVNETGEIMFQYDDPLSVFFCR